MFFIYLLTSEQMSDPAGVSGQGLSLGRSSALCYAPSYMALDICAQRIRGRITPPPWGSGSHSLLGR
jgi:hypothetical protein